MNIGFTGTRQGMNSAQSNWLLQHLKGHKRDEFHHGGALGADLEASQLAHLMGLICFEHRPRYINARNLLKRNREIVDACEVLLVAPRFMREELRSGTWATVRYARKIKRPMVFFWPDGTISRESHEGKEVRT